MFEFFNTVIGYFGAFFQYFLNFINSITTGILFVQNSIAFTVGLIPLVPGIIGSAIVITIGVSVLKFVINR